MAGVPKRRGLRPLALVAGALCTATVACAVPTWADTVNVHIDQARVMKLPERVATIVIGNPMIADASLQTGGILVVTGKGYGSTNLLALDRAGKVILDKTILVVRTDEPDLVTVYKGTARESYSCAPDCAPRITLGDDGKYFGDTMSETGARAGSAQTAAPAPSGTR
jgi:hypothetical protein